MFVSNNRREIKMYEYPSIIGLWLGALVIIAIPVTTAIVIGWLTAKTGKDKKDSEENGIYKYEVISDPFAGASRHYFTVEADSQEAADQKALEIFNEQYRNRMSRMERLYAILK